MTAWDRLNTETAPAWTAFQTYRDQPTRSIRSAREALGKPTGYERLMEEWSSKHDWVARVAAWDAHLDQAVQEKFKAERLKRAQQQAQLGRAMQGVAGAALTKLAKKDLKAGEVAALAKAGFEIERVADGEDDSRIGLNVTMAGATRARLDELFGDKEVKKKEEGANGHA